jgi:hypothetical protein
MKNYFLLLFIGIMLVSCSNDDDNAPDTSAKIIGNWNWIISSGGIGGWTYTPQSTGNTQRLEISSTTIKYYTNGDLVSESAYTIEIRESVIFSGTREMMIMDNEFRNIIAFDGNTLFLTGDCNDCFGSEYVRE